MPGAVAAAYDPAVSNIASVSCWLETAGDDLAARPGIDGTTDADVAILGAGMTGLWTAFYLLRRDPSLKIVVVEREIAGFGASGRNGAWCAPDLNISMSRLATAARGRGRDADPAGDLRRRGRGRARLRRGGDRRRFPQGRRADPGARAAGHPVAGVVAAGVRGVRLRRPLPPPGRGAALGADPGRRRRAGARVRGCGRDPPGTPRPRARATGGAGRRADRRGDGRHGLPAEGRERPRHARHAARRGPGAGDRPGGGGLPLRAAAPASPAGPALVADRPDGTGHGRAVGRDRLGEPRGRGVHAPVDRLPLPDRGRPDPVRRARCAVPVRVADPRGVRPPRADARAAQGVRARVVPRSARCPLHPRVGRTARDAPGLAPDDGVRSRVRASPPPAGTSATACPRRTSAGACWRTSSPGRAARSRSCRWSATGRATGRSSRSAGSACATRSGRWDAWTSRPRGPGRPPSGRSLAERIASH